MHHRRPRRASWRGSSRAGIRGSRRRPRAIPVAPAAREAHERMIVASARRHDADRTPRARGDELSPGLASGRKYGELMSTDSRAAASTTWNSTRAGVERAGDGVPIRSGRDCRSSGGAAMPGNTALSGGSHSSPRASSRRTTSADPQTRSAVTRTSMSRHAPAPSRGRANAAMPAPPTKPMSPSTTMISRCVRLLKRFSVYQRWAGTSHLAAGRSQLREIALGVSRLPMRSTRSHGPTPARARSSSAAQHLVAARPRRKRYTSRWMLRFAAHRCQLGGVDRGAAIEHFELAGGEEARVDDGAQVVHELARVERQLRGRTR